MRTRSNVIIAPGQVAMTLIGWETRASSVVGLYRDREGVRRTIDHLLEVGFVPEEISIVVHGADRGGLPPLAEHDVTGPEGAAVGGLAGLAIGLVALAVPGFGPVLAAGPLAAALLAATSAATGAVVGGVAAGLIHLGLSPDEASRYEERLREGHVLVGVNTSASRLPIAFGILESTGAEHLLAFQDGELLPAMAPTTGAEDQAAGSSTQD
ncbi:MAG: hypothetical protein HY331_05550 [Chloroflexi bacterium]|nr:hypothetical protein [Chloroflexota bacterium]